MPSRREIVIGAPVAIGMTIYGWYAASQLDREDDKQAQQQQPVEEDQPIEQEGPPSLPNVTPEPEPEAIYNNPRDFVPE